MNKLTLRQLTQQTQQTEINWIYSTKSINLDRNRNDDKTKQCWRKIECLWCSLRYVGTCYTLAGFISLFLRCTTVHPWATRLKSSFWELKRPASFVKNIYIVAEAKCGQKCSPIPNMNALEPNLKPFLHHSKSRYLITVHATTAEGDRHPFAIDDLLRPVWRAASTRFDVK